MKTYKQLLAELRGYEVKSSEYEVNAKNRAVTDKWDNSKRCGQTSDCTVKAVANAEGLMYDVAFDRLKALGRKNNACFDIEYRYFRGNKKYEKRDFPKYTKVKDIGATLKRGVFIVLSEQYGKNGKSIKSRHAFAVIDGVVQDSGNYFATDTVYAVYKYKGKRQ